MAIVNQMPAQDIIDGFHGVLDFYRWCNLVIVRKWPHHPTWKSSPEMKASQQSFAYVNKMASQLPEHVIQTWKDLATGGPLTWKDYLNRFYLSASFEGKDRPTT